MTKKEIFSKSWDIRRLLVKRPPRSRWKWLKAQAALWFFKLGWRFFPPERRYTEGFPKLEAFYSAKIEEKYDRWPKDLSHVTDEEYFPKIEPEWLKE